MNINHRCKYLEDDAIEVKAYVMNREIIIKLTRAAQKLKNHFTER